MLTDTKTFRTLFAMPRRSKAWVRGLDESGAGRGAEPLPLQNHRPYVMVGEQFPGEALLKVKF